MPDIMEQTEPILHASNDKIMGSRWFFAALCGLAFLLTSSGTFAQNSIYPTVLYSGVNPFTVSASDGIEKIEIYTNDGWKPLVIGLRTRYYRVMSSPVFRRCAKQATFSLFVERIDQNFDVEIRVTDCDGSRRKYSVGLENTWTLFYEDFGTVTLDDRPCHTFSVQSNSGSFVVDKVVSSSNQFEIRYPFRKPPLRIQGAQVYRYSVCFTPRQVGRIQIPIYVHIRREQPVGEYTTYIVADTAYVNVIPSPNARTPVRTPPPPVVAAPPPRPRAPRLPPDGPTPPPKPAPQVLEAQPMAPESLVDFVESTPIVEEPVLDDTTTPEEFIFDPTTFRTILTPTARSLGKGRGFVGSYDVAGIVAGYGLTDRLTIIGGGVYVPASINETFAVSGGAKYEFYRDEMLRAAGGVQINFSGTEESEIFLAAPYATVNYGTLDRSASLTAGYSWRRHSPSDTSIAPFTKQAILVGAGGDFRFANRWKVAGEIFYIQNSEFQPLALTLRYFGHRFAIDGGIAVDMTPDETVAVLPVLSVLWTW